MSHLGIHFPACDDANISAPLEVITDDRSLILDQRGDQYTFIALASSAKAILSYRTGKHDSEKQDVSSRRLVLAGFHWSVAGFDRCQRTLYDDSSHNNDGGFRPVLARGPMINVAPVTLPPGRL
jgi:hypothetical protein